MMAQNYKDIIALDDGINLKYVQKLQECYQDVIFRFSHYADVKYERLRKILLGEENILFYCIYRNEPLFQIDFSRNYLGSRYCVI